uniref:WGS project CAEQ00000000 data, annotated contig 1829 n=1 Tax=Trypanosoma congolense (strain IL3000) TaxID=1068625 RepID=F9W971_TRYCI|nr:unnamed protein product [Trypanosoma congolense IL3000]
MQRETEGRPKRSRASSERQDINDILQEDNCNNDYTTDLKDKWRSRVCSTASFAFAWAFGVLIVLFLVFIAFGVLYSGIRYRGGSNTCSNSFGAITGTHSGVFSYSNCGMDVNAIEHHNVTVEGRTQTTGVKWQCVEYARRYWVLRGTPKPAAFGSVEGAADIWDLDNVALLDGTTRPLLKFQNENATAAGSRPRAGDLLIYPRQPNGFPYGHVAVVAGVEERRLFVAEQNWDNQQWPGPYHNYSRELKLTCDASSTRCSVHEEGNIVVQGWVRYE